MSGPTCTTRMFAESFSLLAAARRVVRHTLLPRCIIAFGCESRLITDDSLRGETCTLELRGSGLQFSSTSLSSQHPQTSRYGSETGIQIHTR